MWTSGVVPDSDLSAIVCYVRVRRLCSIAVLVTVVFDAAFGRKCAVTGIISLRGRPKPLSYYDNVYIAPVPIAHDTVVPTRPIPDLQRVPGLGRSRNPRRRKDHEVNLVQRHTFESRAKRDLPQSSATR